MPVPLVPENDLREALRPFRSNPDVFNRAVHERLAIAERELARNRLGKMSPLSRAAAALLPSPLIAQGSASLGSVSFVYKLLSYLAFPAICLFLLSGAAFVSVVKIQKLQGSNSSGIGDLLGLQQWWKARRWGAVLVLAGSLTLSWIGATSLLFLFYIISLGLLLHILAGYKEHRLANRVQISQSCAMGLMFLVQLSQFPSIGRSEIHLLDQSVLQVVFAFGVVVLFSTGTLRLSLRPNEMTPAWVYGLLLIEMAAAMEALRRDSSLTSPWVVIGVIVCELALLLWANVARTTGFGTVDEFRQWVVSNWFSFVSFPCLALWACFCVVPVTTAEIKRHVESFDYAPFYTATWAQWEIPARWAIDSKLDLDLSKPRRLLAKEIEGEQNPFILGTAFRTGLIEPEQIDQLRDYKTVRQVLLGNPQFDVEYPVLSLPQMDWIIRAAVAKNDLTAEERNVLQIRLNLTLEQLNTDVNNVLCDAVLVTELLQVIRRPVDVERHRSSIHIWLRKCHVIQAIPYATVGGFTSPPTFIEEGKLIRLHPSLESTANAIHLMEVYGIPDGMDLDFVRSYLCTWAFRPGEDRWIAPALLNRLNHLPGIKPVDWWKVLYNERSILAAMVLVAMCFYATFTSPNLTVEEMKEIYVASNTREGLPES